MMDKFPRDKQNELLMFLYDKFPNNITNAEYKNLTNLFGSTDNFVANVWYLSKHGLVENCIQWGADDKIIYYQNLKITEKGVDFIRDDGGLSSILNVTTIKIHNETLEKLEDIIKQSSLTETEKKTYLGKLKELPVDATKHLVLKLLDLGLSRTPDVIQLISSCFQP